MQLVQRSKSVLGTAIAQKGNESFLREEEIVAFQAIEKETGLETEAASDMHRNTIISARLIVE